jgi:hypothetical protein
MDLEGILAEFKGWYGCDESRGAWRQARDAIEEIKKELFLMKLQNSRGL